MNVSFQVILGTLSTTLSATTPFPHPASSQRKNFGDSQKVKAAIITTKTTATTTTIKTIIIIIIIINSSVFMFNFEWGE